MPDARERLTLDYVLGRCLGLESALKALLDDMHPVERKRALRALHSRHEVEMERLIESLDDDHHQAVVSAGFVHALEALGVDP